MRSYKCLKTNQYSLDSYVLLPVRKEDIMLIRDWRNAQLTVLRQQQPLTEAAQYHYFATVIWPTFEQKQPAQLLFSLLRDNYCIGYGGIVHISWEDRRGEVSFLLNPVRVADARIYRQDFLAFLYLIKQAAYHGLGLNRLFTETFDIRPLHISILEEAGFRHEGRMKQHIMVDGAFVDSVLHGHLKEYDYHVGE